MIITGLCDLSGASLLTTNTAFDLGVGGVESLVLRLNMAFTDATSYEVSVYDNGDSAMVGEGPAPLLTLRQSTKETLTEQSFASTDSADDTLILQLGKAFKKLRVSVKRTGGTNAAGNRVQIEARRVHG